VTVQEGVKHKQTINLKYFQYLSISFLLIDNFQSSRENFRIALRVRADIKSFFYFFLIKNFNTLDFDLSTSYV